MARTSDRREFVQLAHVYDPTKHGVNGWFVSEKLDGMRALWDGGITRGMYTKDIPFANVAKDGIRIAPPKSTGLWSRYGKPIQAPLWFLDELPPFPLDGELTTGRGNFQQTMSAVRKLEPLDHEWEKVNYKVFDLPDYTDVFQDGRINVPQWSTQFKDVITWLKTVRGLKSEPKRRRFETVVFLLNEKYGNASGIVQAIPQTRLPYSSDATQAKMNELLDEVLTLGGEGLILRHYNSIWEPKRTNFCLKVKPFDDAEVIVKGYISGRETDRGSKLLGKMGAMITEFQGKRLELSGFTDQERLLFDCDKFDSRDANASAIDWCENNPGKEVPANIASVTFPRGSQVTIRYRELTNDGLPKEARYFRPRPSE